MIPKSVRWRLPLSYAAIALLAALALGFVLLTTLRGYYRQQELDYLTNNAEAVGSAITRLLELDLPSTQLQPQLHSFAFLSQTRVRLLDAESQVMADSGAPQEQQALVTLAREATKLDIQNAAEMPDTPADAGGLLVRRGDHSLFVGTGNLSGVLVDGEWKFDHDGPVVEVMVTDGTLIYRDDTLQQLGGVAPSGPIQQLLEPGSLAEIGPNSFIQAWGESHRDGVVADVIVFSPQTNDSRVSPADERAMGEQPPGVALMPSTAIYILPAASQSLAESGRYWSAPIAYSYSTSVVATPYGLGLNAEASADGHRSDQVARQPFYDRQGETVGYVELSEGPAYGRQILGSVTRGWALASSVAVLLAAIAGWLTSRRITSPLLSLAQVTASMAAGDLGARADVSREDEFGTLARSYNHMADRVERMVDTLRRFVCDAAHELHTPLATLRTDLEMVQQASLPGQDKRVARAQAQVERLEALTTGMLDLSRIESNASQETFVPVLLTTLTQEVGELYASRAEQAGLTFEMLLAESPVRVCGNEGQLRCVLTNLLDNAIKFTLPGGHVWLGLCRKEDVAVLWVEDTGIGIPEADMPLLFQRFHRGRNTAAFAGNGLGLAIVKAIVEGHDGQVQAESTEQGTRFTLRIPTSGGLLLQIPG